ncbi:MAG TPA: MBL fold metallo-hydrolase [Blastocatellia bacterium]|nr:MBL fold metallo-hydrolase [Blastocatellia bacterium]
MENELLYLRPNIQVEPLFDHWYAWSYLIPPATAARYLTERHLKIMNSYISAPQVHATAVKNPRLLGGPFIDYGGGRVEEIERLREQTKRRYPHLMELSAAIAALEEMLRTLATGYSLHPLYDKVPDILKGYVELGYDLNNHPGYRLIEPLLYKSKYYDRSAQSLMLSTISGDDRPFVFSTPRLESDSLFHLRVPFDDEVVDRLFELKSSPRPWGEIAEMLKVPQAAAPLVRSFFTPSPPPPFSPYRGKGVRWRYFGHACILLETPEVNMLFDPVLSYTYESNVSRYTYMDLPDRIDYVIITHNHQDHVMLETLLQIRHKVKNIIVPTSSGGSLQDPSLRLTLNNIGFKNVIELDDLESISWEDGAITAIPFLGEHSDLNIRSKTAYVVRLGSRSILFAADSCNIEPRMYDHLQHEFGDLDALFLGMECDGAPLTWLYGPLLTRSLDRSMDESRRLNGSNFEQAMDLVRRFNCPNVYVYAMGQEPWLGYVLSLKYTEKSRPIVDSNRLLSECCALGIAAERLFGEKEILIEETYSPLYERPASRARGDGQATAGLE